MLYFTASMSTMESYLATELCTACTRGDLDNVKRLIELGASPWIRDDQGNTLFHLCCSSVQCGLEVLDYLISVSGIVDCDSLVNNEGSSLLHLACITSKLEFVRLLFVQHQGGFVLHHDIHGHSPLYYACNNQHSDIVLFICSQNIVLSPDDIYQCVKISTWEIMVPLLKKISFKDFMNRVIQEDHVTLAKLVTKDNVVQWLDTTTLFPLHHSVTLGDVNIVHYLILTIGYNPDIKDNNDQTPLNIACSYSGNVELVRYLVEEVGCDINATGKNGATSLHIACGKNQLEIVKFLISKPECNRESPDKFGNLPLHLACLLSGNVELVRYLVEKACCDINAKGNNDYTSLHWACHKNQLEIVTFLTSKPECNHEAGDKDGNRPLHIACMFSGNVELVRYLVEEVGCDINAKGNDDYTSLHWACEKNQLEIVKFLTSKPECNRESANKFDNLPLHLACLYSDNVELVRYLVEEACCDINAKGNCDYTSLHWACEKNQLEIVKFLTSKPECNRESANKFDNLPLHLACLYSDNVELVRYLVEEACCDINAKGNCDYTSLHWACEKNQLEIVKFLTSKPECNRESANKFDNLPLHLACLYSGNVELVRYLVEEACCDINAKGNNDYTSLHWACEKNQLEIVKFLTSKPECNRESANKFDNLPLHLACLYSGNVELVRYLVEKAGCDINAKGNNDYTSLHWSCHKNQLEIVKFLTSKSECDREAVGNNGNRPLHIACLATGNVELVRYLVEKAGCDINAKGNNDYTSLHWSCHKNQLEIVKFLTSKSECDREAVDNDGNRPLHIACLATGNVELVRYLVEKAGCDINAKGNNDYTSLHWACDKNQLEIVKFLTSKPECNHEVGDKNSNRPLHIACLATGNVELVRYLVKEAGCDINAKGNNDSTSLHMACLKNQLEIVKFLTSKPECNRESPNKFDYRPLHVACSLSGNVELVRYLVEEAGCDINAKGKNDCTSLHVACEKNQLEIVKFLTSKPECNRESPDKFDDRPLHVACSLSGNVELVRYLVEEAGCDINAKGQNDSTSLHIACLKNQLEINAKGNNDYTSLHWSCHKNQLEIVKFLTSKPECNRESANKFGDLPLHLACSFSGNVELVRYLVEEAGCDINATGKNGATSLHLACEKNQLEIVMFLISKPECNQESPDKFGNLPLHIACCSGNVELVSYLVEEASCDINAKGQNDYTSLHLACGKNQLEIVKFLTSKPECNRESPDEFGNLPLHIACCSGNVELVRYLVEEAGCDINVKDHSDRFPLQIACNLKNKHLVKYFISRPECQTLVSLIDTNYDDELESLLEYHNKFQQALKSSGVMCLRAVKCILTGPPGAGKSTLKKRLLNETLLEPCNSTGVVDSAIQVKSFRKLQQENALVSGLEDSVCKWKKHELDEEAVYLFERVLSSTLAKPVSSDINNSILSLKHIYENNKPVEVSRKTNDSIYNTSTVNSENIEIQDDITTYIHNDNESDDGNYTTLDLIDERPVITSNVKAVQTLSETVQSTYVINRAKLEDTDTSEQIDESSHALLHIIDTGGQPEFHEILPALITGPAINLLTFKLTDDIKSCFKITYRSSNGDLEPYESSLTLEEAIFRSLASIACLRENTIGWTFDELPVKDISEPAAFLIATHRDCVDESKVAEVNEQLKVKIQNSVELFHENLVLFSSKEQVIFALDTIRDQENIEHLRTALHNVMLTNFNELHIPVSWCSFNVLLRKSEKSIFKLDACYKLAQKCGISDRDEFMSALWFLHHRVGSIMYYPEVMELKDIVIIDLQLVFDHITQLITSSFTFRGIQRPGSEERFRTLGQFSESTLKRLFLRNDDPLTPLKLVSLLKHLHIIAGPMKGFKNENYYFLPCALKPATLEQDVGDLSMFPAPLLIYFECGYCPVGMFCSLVVHLISTTQQSGLKWTLDKPPHYRNKITFLVGKCYDKITLISRATYLEISINRIPEISEALPLSELCLAVYKTLNTSIQIVTESLHYTNKTHHFFGFPCTVCQSSPPHPAICEHPDPVAARCVHGKGFVPLLEQHTIWINEVKL